MKMFVFYIIFKTSDEYLLYFGQGLRSPGVFPRHGSFQLHVVSVHNMWPGGHCCIGLLGSRVGHKAETTGPL
uniref:Uncharacterized protein n=1 Tax=Anguilla anguilla TaxID=7936 RepID=A0A0E9SBZ0_ANGAN